MSFEMISWIVGTGVIVLGLLLTIVQYHNKQLSQFYSDKYEKLDKKCEVLENEIKQLRSELAREYVRQSSFVRTVQDFREDINKVYEGLNNLSNGLHQLIGELKGSKKNGT